MLIICAFGNSFEVFNYLIYLYINHCKDINIIFKKKKIQVEVRPKDTASYKVRYFAIKERCFDIIPLKIKTQTV